MERRSLGSRGPNISAIALGTVSLGVDYGIRAPGQSGQPDAAQAQALLRFAREHDVSLFDTAPAYGTSEEILGQGLGADGAAVFATKVSVPKDGDGGTPTGEALRDVIRTSVARSRERLGRERLDVVQIHNATVELIEEGELTRILEALRAEGQIAQLGASVYTEAEALAAIACGSFQVLQVAYNLLDRKMAARVFPAAQRAGIGVLVRSAYLKGALTDKAEFLPPELAALRTTVNALLRVLGATYAELPSIAVRYCLSADIASVLIGARTIGELEVALMAAKQPPLSVEQLAAIESVSVPDERLLNPATWPVP